MGDDDPHLSFRETATGLRWYAMLPKGGIRLRESGREARTSFWLDVTQPIDVTAETVQMISIEITEETARQLAEQLDYAVYTHRHNRKDEG